jgi:PKD repeat protein
LGNPVTHVYTIAGEYTVTLTATNGCGVEMVQDMVVVEAPPLPMQEIYLPLVVKAYGP